MSVRDLAALRPRLRSALVSDALDRLGVRANAVAGVTPLHPDHVLVGRAFPVTTVVVDAPPERPYVGLLAALDALPPDGVWVVSAMGRPDVALWGELLTTIAQAAGAAGVVCDGPVRDVRSVLAARFPCFCRGTVPYDINGRLEVTGFGEPIAIGGVAVPFGALMVGDADGIVVVPAELEDEVVASALEKSRGEDGFRDAVRAGVKASEAFARHRVL
jgi:4-hydroxy-4-methyl-2-oxoglutarate aldolase